MGLSVELTDVHTQTEGPDGWGRFGATIRFRNHATESLWVVKPLDGSRDGRVKPYYNLSVTGPVDPDERVRGRCIYCGKWANTEWPRDYLLQVPAGKTAEIKGAIGGVLRGAGRYTLEFEYVYLPDGKPMGWPPQDFPPPAQAWRGQVKASPFVLDYKPNPNWRPPADEPPVALDADGEDRVGTLGQPVKK